MGIYLYKISISLVNLPPAVIRAELKKSRKENFVSYASRVTCKLLEAALTTEL